MEAKWYSNNDTVPTERLHYRPVLSLKLWETSPTWSLPDMGYSKSTTGTNGHEWGIRFSEGFFLPPLKKMKIELWKNLRRRAIKHTINKIQISLSLLIFFKTNPRKQIQLKRAVSSYFTLSANQCILWLHKQPFCIYKKNCKTNNIFLRFMSCPLIELIQGGRKEPKKSPLSTRFPHTHTQNLISQMKLNSLVLESHRFKNFS